MVLGMKIKTFLTFRCVSPLNFSILVDAGPLHSTKMKFSITDFLSKCDQIRSFLWIWSHLLKKSLMEKFIFVQCYAKDNIPILLQPGNNLNSFFSDLLFNKYREESLGVI